MISVFSSKTVAALQERIADLEMQVESLSARLSSANNELSAISDGLTTATRGLDARMMDAEQRSQAIARLVADQAEALMRLDEREERQQELDRQIRADMIRLERQATIDVTELRQTSLVLADRLLAGGRGTGAL